MREERAKNTAPLYDVNVVQESSLQRVKFFFSSDATILFLIKAKTKTKTYVLLICSLITVNI